MAKVGREICRGSALYQSLSDTSKGRLCYDLTIAFRDVATALTVTQSDLEKLQGINEIQHKALSQMLAHQSGRAERYADREFFLLLLDMSKNYKGVRVFAEPADEGLGSRASHEFGVAKVLKLPVGILPTGASMPSVEKISIALPPEMVAQVRKAVETGEYASSSEVVRDALRDWARKRAPHANSIQDLRALWREAVKDKRPGVDMEEVMDRLERKYQAKVERKR